MKAASDIRLENLEMLVNETGTADALAERSGLSPVYLSQIRSRAIDRKTGKPRNLGSQAARKLETGTGKPEGWMDQQHGGLAQTAANDWPFAAITPERYQQLPDRLKGVIEGRALALIEEWEMTSIKSHSDGRAA